MNRLFPEGRNTLAYPVHCKKNMDSHPERTVCKNREKEPTTLESDRALLCSHCKRLITYQQFMTEINGTLAHTQCNPSGILFRYRCYLNASGCIIGGPPVSEFSWHSGYRWQYAYCSGCGQHLGWFFSGRNPSFFGLQIHLIVPGDVSSG